jgi:hypothetical protein
MGICYNSNQNNQYGVINLNDLTKNQQKIHTTNNETNNQNNDECSILISSSSMELNYNVKYRESGTLQMYEKSQNNKN